MAVDIRKTLDLLVRTQETTLDTRTKAPLAQVSTDLRAFLQEQEDARNKLVDSLHQSEASVADLTGKVADLTGQVSAQAKQVADLTRRLEAATAGSSANSSTPLGLATSFKQVIDSIQSEARSAPGVATTVKSLDIEIKGLVQVNADNTTVMVLPAEKSAIDPNSLSTLRVTFGAIPVAAATPLASKPVTATTPAAPTPAVSVPTPKTTTPSTTTPSTTSTTPKTTTTPATTTTTPSKETTTPVRPRPVTRPTPAVTGARPGIRPVIRRATRRPKK